MYLTRYPAFDVAILGEFQSRYTNIALPPRPHHARGFQYFQSEFARVLDERDNTPGGGGGYYANSINNSQSVSWAPEKNTPPVPTNTPIVFDTLPAIDKPSKACFYFLN